jgi:hypothetical protein
VKSVTRQNVGGKQASLEQTRKIIRDEKYYEAIAILDDVVE